MTSCAIVAMEKALAPPPEGSTATKKWLVLRVMSRGSCVMSGHARFMKFSISPAPNARSEPSAEMPSDCERLRARLLRRAGKSFLR